MSENEEEHLRSAIRRLVDGAPAQPLSALQDRGHRIGVERRRRRAAITGVVAVIVALGGVGAASRVSTGRSGRSALVVSGRPRHSGGRDSASSVATSTASASPPSCLPSDLRSATQRVSSAWPSASQRPNLAAWPDYKGCAVVVVVGRPLSAEEKQALVDSTPSVRLTVVVGVVSGRD